MPETDHLGHEISKCSNEDFTSLSKLHEIQDNTEKWLNILRDLITEIEIKSNINPSTQMYIKNSTEDINNRINRLNKADSAKAVWKYIVEKVKQ